MRKLSLSLVIMMAAFTLFIGCGTDGESSPGVNQSSEPIDTAAVGDKLNAMTDNIEITRLALMHALPLVIQGPNSEFSLSTCPEIDWDIDWQGRTAVVSIDYGEGCEFFNGHEAAGLIVVDAALAEGAIPLGVTFEEFEIDGVPVVGSLLVEMSLFKFVVDGQLQIGGETAESASVFLAACAFEFDLGEEVFNPADDAGFLYGAIVYVDGEGTEYYVTIPEEEKVTFGGGCMFPLDGMIYAQFTLYVPVIAWIDFGYPTPGACDSEFDWDISIE